ncbi:hypothetical protein D9M70_473380 [compost metagenome]
MVQIGRALGKGIGGRICRRSGGNAAEFAFLGIGVAIGVGVRLVEDFDLTGSQRRRLAGLRDPLDVVDIPDVTQHGGA